MINIDVPSFLEAAFLDGYSYRKDIISNYNFYIVDIGLLYVPTGKIIGCDPFLFNEDKPFNVDFPIGRFRIELAVAKINNDERVGFARIKFSDNNPLRWSMAVDDGQNIEDLKPGDIYGYGVDAGTGSFMDASAGQEFTGFYIEKDDNYLVLIDEMEKTYKDTWSWLLWERNGFNVAMFSSGWGDGLYASYIGYDVDNNICRLVTDFGLLDWPG